MSNIAKRWDLKNKCFVLCCKMIDIGNWIVMNCGIWLSLITSVYISWAESSEFVSSSIPSWQTLTAHAQPFRGARDLAFRLKVPLDSLLVWASSEGSGETARMRRLAWTFAARIGDKYQIRLARPSYWNLSRGAGNFARWPFFKKDFSGLHWKLVSNFDILAS